MRVTHAVCSSLLSHAGRRMQMGDGRVSSLKKQVLDTVGVLREKTHVREVQVVDGAMFWLLTADDVVMCASALCVCFRTFMFCLCLRADPCIVMVGTPNASPQRGARLVCALSRTLGHTKTERRMRSGR